MNPSMVVRRSLGLALAAGAVITVAGCSAAEPIETLTVTESEYRAAFAEFVDCMDAEGFGVIINDDSGTVIDYAIPGEAVQSGAEETCYTPFMPIDAAWQVANEDTSETALLIRECLEGLGYESDGTSAGDWRIIQENGLESTCGTP